MSMLRGYYRFYKWSNSPDRYCVQSSCWSDEDKTIDPSTLAIHFPDMLDSEGTKIFASLSEDGMGGDIDQCERTYVFKTKLILVDKNLDEWDFEEENKILNMKVTGIQQ